MNINKKYEISSEYIIVCSQIRMYYMYEYSPISIASCEIREHSRHRKSKGIFLLRRDASLARDVILRASWSRGENWSDLLARKDFLAKNSEYR